MPPRNSALSVLHLFTAITINKSALLDLFTMPSCLQRLVNLCDFYCMNKASLKTVKVSLTSLEGVFTAQVSLFCVDFWLVGSIIEGVKVGLASKRQSPLAD